MSDNFKFSDEFNQSLDAVQVAAADIEQEKQIQKNAVPRRRLAGPPSQRDLDIFKMAVIEHVSHGEIAYLKGINRSRVSQIVGQVKRYLAQAATDDPEIKNHLAQQRLEQALEKLRLEYVLEITAKTLRDSPRPLTSSRTGDRVKDGGSKEIWNERTVREQRLDVQALKAFLRATDSLSKLSRQAPGSSALPAKRLTNDDLLWAIQIILEEFSISIQYDEHRPSPKFMAMLSAFRVNLCSWVLEVRRGTPQSLADKEHQYSLFAPLTALTSPPPPPNLNSPPPTDPPEDATPVLTITSAIPSCSTTAPNAPC